MFGLCVCGVPRALLMTSFHRARLSSLAVKTKKTDFAIPALLLRQALLKAMQTAKTGMPRALLHLRKGCMHSKRLLSLRSGLSRARVEGVAIVQSVSAAAAGVGKVSVPKEAR